MRCLLLGALAALVVACGKDPAPVAPVTFNRRPGRPGERFAVRVEHRTINQVSPHQAVEVSKKGDYVDEVQPAARVIRSGSFDDDSASVRTSSSSSRRCSRPVPSVPATVGRRATSGARGACSRSWLRS
ncbi:MAG: hypothetical protein ACYTDU_11285 [Planctomycetota bacterium]